jgi:hypothetical protein
MFFSRLKKPVKNHNNSNKQILIKTQQILTFHNHK